MGEHTDTAEHNYAGVFDGRLGFGRRPALLVIDFIAAYTDRTSPLYAQTASAAVDRTADLARVARNRGVPVIFTRVLYSPGGAEGGLFVRKVPVLRRLVEGEPLALFVTGLEPEPNDTVITKQYASAFFGTSLASLLTAQAIDTVILTGVSTSGCIRATAVDAIQHGFRAVVPRDCVADRHQSPHEANLFDIDAKYGDVVSCEDVILRLNEGASP